MSEQQRDWDDGAAQANFEQLGENPYPGRLIVLGQSPSGEEAVQVYAVMGRSENSRNRVLLQEDDVIRTDAFDSSTMTDPSLVIYDAMRDAGISHSKILNKVPQDIHIVSNGAQTSQLAHDLHFAFNTDDYANADAIKAAFAESLTSGTSALDNVTSFEPDDPNFTPRITGYVGVRQAQGYAWAITRRDNLTATPVHSFGGGLLENLPLGKGLAFHTYDGDGSPLPSFSGLPYPVPVQSTAAETAEAFWEGALDKENRVALAVKFINLVSGLVEVKIINQLQPEISSIHDKKDILIASMLDRLKPLTDDMPADVQDAIKAERDAIILRNGWDRMSLAQLEAAYLHGTRRLPYATS